MICFFVRLSQWRLFLPIVLCSVLCGCSKNEEAVVVNLDGSYAGTFERTGGNSNTAAPVALSFAGLSWSGQSEVEHYPALCYGTYSVAGNQLTIANYCTWTTDFDWSLILSGNYNLAKTGDTLLIWRSYDNDRKDIYKLVKE